MGHISLILGTVVAVLVSILWRFVVPKIWRFYSVTKKLQKQGIKGPKFSFWSGNLKEMKSLKMVAWGIELDINSHDIIPRVLPHYRKWIDQYGQMFLFWGESTPIICITNPEKVKQILFDKFGLYNQIKLSGNMMTLLGKGLAFTNGSEWVRHKSVVTPAFTMEKLKAMTKKMAESTLSMLDKWHKVIQADEQDTSIDVNRDFKELTADIISHAAFGSSYLEGKEVFSAQDELQQLILETMDSVQIPGFNYLPTKQNLKRWELDRKMKNRLKNMINSRLKSKNSGYGNDLLGVLVESMEKQDGYKLNVNEIIDECKTFYFGGHETTSQLLTWTMFLLSTNPEWQDKLRDEVVRECGREVPNAENLSKFKLMTMVLWETLRLYSPVLTVERIVAQDHDLGGTMIPKGTQLSIPIAILHRQKELWGENADEFDPLRFENGVVKASTLPNAMLSFSIGPRACIGQNFGMLEAKMAIAMFLQKFSFSLSENYRHKPMLILTLQPQNGLHIVLKPQVA